MKKKRDFEDFTGKTFGYFTVISLYGIGKFSHGTYSLWKCQCTCGTIKILRKSALKRKDRPVSCGCSRTDNSLKTFHSNYEKKEGCWVWKGKLNKGGYGRIGLKDTAHRRSYQIYKGPIPEGLCVCHSCDNPSCVNPDHLFLGTHKDNTQDMILKNRGIKGSKVYSSKLTEQNVLEIRKLRIQGKQYEELANKYQVHWETIASICRNQTWKHVPLGLESKKVPQIRKHVRGSQSGQSKLNENQVLEIIKKLNCGESAKNISIELGINYWSICNIRQKKSWKHLLENQ